MAVASVTMPRMPDHATTKASLADGGTVVGR